jgi:hypothetical protein
MEGRPKNTGISDSFVQTKKPPIEMSRRLQRASTPARHSLQTPRETARLRGARRARMSASTSSGSNRGESPITSIRVAVV